MGIAGAGFGAAKGLEQIIAEQMIRAQQAAREQEAATRSQIDRDRLNETIRMNDVDTQRNTRLDDERSAAKRQVSNSQGVRRMIADAMMQRTGPMTPDDGRGIVAMQIEAGDNPDVGLMQEPKQARDPIADHRAIKEIDAQFAKPEKPARDPIADHRAIKEIDAQYAKKSGEQPPSAYSQERAARTVQSVDELMGKVSRRTTGLGSLMSMIPETEARNFAAELQTLKSNIAFNELTAMREASKTGGALGQVSDKEALLLQSALGALDAGQSPENIKAQLQKIKDSVQRWQSAGGKGGDMKPLASHDATGAKPTSKFTIIKQQ